MTIFVTQTLFQGFITPYLEPTIIYFNGAEGEALNSMTKDERDSAPAGGGWFEFPKDLARTIMGRIYNFVPFFESPPQSIQRSQSPIIQEAKFKKRVLLSLHY